MMGSLESRAIFLDNDLVDFCRRLPNRFQVSKRRSQVPAEEGVRRYLPADILPRPKKGFGIPLAKWLRELAPPAGAVPLLRPAAVARRWKEHRSKTADHRLFLWTWLSLQQCLSPRPGMKSGSAGRPKSSITK